MRYAFGVGRVVAFAGPGVELDGVALIHRRQRAPVEDAARRGILRAIVLDARTPDDFLRGCDLLRALFDHPRHPRPPLSPARILAVIADGDVEAAFALGRYGLAGVIEARHLATLGPRLRDLLGEEEGEEGDEEDEGDDHEGPARSRPLALDVPNRSLLLTPRAAEALPTVAIGYRHPPSTRRVLSHYVQTLREHAAASSVFADVALLIERMLAENLTCQTELATKAGVTHTGQFVGSFGFYRELRRTRYANIPDDPRGLVDMAVFVAVDEILHEVLHLLYLANTQRAGLVSSHPRLAEEISLSWWQGVVHNRVFPDWIDGPAILQINEDFVYCEQKQETWEFWTIGNVFDQYAQLPWVRHVLAQLPRRDAYIGQRADLDELVASLEQVPAAAFLRPRAGELRMQIPFADYPELPPSLRLVAG